MPFLGLILIVAFVVTYFYMHFLTIQIVTCLIFQAIDFLKHIDNIEVEGVLPYLSWIATMWWGGMTLVCLLKANLKA